MRRATLKLLGQTFGRLTVKGKSAARARYWDCQCSCGGSTQVRADHLTSGKIKSCGCMKITNGQTVGGRLTPTYQSWKSMKARCNNTENAAYGGRGISYDPAWESFERFVADMGTRPVGTSLDRLDAFNGYSKGNCQWGDKTQQARNKRGVIFHSYDVGGPLETSATAPEWANTLMMRTFAPWTAKDVRRLIKLNAFDLLMNACHPDAPGTAELEERRKRREARAAEFQEA